MIYFVYFSFYYSFEVEKTNTFMRSRGSPENHKTIIIMVKIYSRFQTNMAHKPYPLGGTHQYSLHRRVPSRVKSKAPLQATCPTVAKGTRQGRHAPRNNVTVILIGSGFGEPGGTPLLRIPRSTPFPGRFEYEYEPSNRVGMI